MDHVDPEVRYWSRRRLEPSDIAGSPEPSDGDIELDVYYRFEWSEFVAEDWTELGRPYESLPGWAGLSDGPRWFNPDDDVPPFLVVSVEPPGLQVTGVLPFSLWVRWDEAFRAALPPLPIRDGEC